MSETNEQKNCDDQMDVDTTNTTILTTEIRSTATQSTTSTKKSRNISKNIDKLDALVQLVELHRNLEMSSKNGKVKFFKSLSSRNQSSILCGGINSLFKNDLRSFTQIKNIGLGDLIDNVARSGFQTLPPVILAHILKYFEVLYICKNLQCVSRDWFLTTMYQNYWYFCFFFLKSY